MIDHVVFGIIMPIVFSVVFICGSIVAIALTLKMIHLMFFS